MQRTPSQPTCSPANLNGRTESPALQTRADEASPQGARAAVEPWLFKCEDIATRLQVSVRTVKRMAAEGAIPGVCRPYGRVLRFCRRTVEQWVRDGCPRPRRKG
jgi:excisionase family DNA binding protein